MADGSDAGVIGVYTPSFSAGFESLGVSASVPSLPVHPEVERGEQTDESEREGGRGRTD
jgi:hypothetical protein